MPLAAAGGARAVAWQATTIVALALLAGLPAACRGRWSGPSGRPQDRLL